MDRYYDIVGGWDLILEVRFPVISCSVTINIDVLFVLVSYSFLHTGQPLFAGQGLEQYVVIFHAMKKIFINSHVLS